MKRYALPLLTLAAALTLTACGGSNAAEGDKTACGLYKEAVDIFATIADRSAPNEDTLSQITDKLNSAEDAAEDLHLQDKLVWTRNNIEKFSETQNPGMLDSFASQTTGVVEMCQELGVTVKLTEDLQTSR